MAVTDRALRLDPDAVPRRAFGIATQLPCTAGELRVLTRPQLLLVRRGALRVHAEGCEAVVPDGHAVTLPGGVPARISTTRTVQVAAVYLWAGQLAGDAPRVFPSTPLLREMVEQAAAWGLNPPDTEAADAFFVALGGLAVRWQQQSSELVLPRATSADVQRGLDWLAVRLGRPVSPIDAANQSGQSLRTFQRRCRTELRMSPSAWLQRARVLHAIELLEDPQLTVPEVALRCGYQSQASFGRVFKEHLGQTPIAWRARRPTT